MTAAWRGSGAPALGWTWKAVGWSSATGAMESADTETASQASSTMLPWVKSGQSSVRDSYSPPSPHTLLPYSLHGRGAGTGW